MSKLTSSDFFLKKRKADRLALLTAYDYFASRQIAQAGFDAILVGDSLGMVALGYQNTLPVTMDEMIHHTKAVRRGAPDLFLIGDIPFEACRDTPAKTLKAAERFLDEGGCDAVKMEGAEGMRLESIRLMLKKQIAVMGHVGLMPQILAGAGKPLKVQGTDAAAAKKILNDAHVLASLGVFSIVLEGVPPDLAGRITQEIKPPTIGIGAGPKCDGQILVTDDLLGRYDHIRPKFVKQYMDSARLTQEALTSFRKEVQAGTFPTQEHSY